MKRRFTFLAMPLLVAGALLLASCASTPRVSTDMDAEAPFADYRTFAFYAPLAMESSGYSTPLTKAIRKSIEREMLARGYVYDEKTPNLLVNFQGVIEEKQNYYGYPYPYADFGYYYGYRSSAYFGTGLWYSDAMVRTYTEGTLSVDLVDAVRNQMVWTGSAVGRVRDEKAAQRAIQADQAITSIFAQYPYRVGGAPMTP